MVKRGRVVEKIKWIKRHLDARGKGTWSYDYPNDVLQFGVKDQNYDTSIEMGNIIVDFNPEDYIIGLRIMDASKVFKISRYVLSHIRGFEFNAMVENRTITIQLSMTYLVRNHEVSQPAMNFIRDAVNQNLQNSQAIATA